MRHLAIALSLLPTLAFADAPPAPSTIDMTTPITDWHGNPIPDATKATSDDPGCDHCGPLTVGSAIAGALCRDTKQTAAESGIAKAKRCALGLRVMDQKTATLTAAEVKEIEDYIGLWSAAVVMRVLPLIDPNLDLSKP